MRRKMIRSASLILSLMFLVAAAFPCLASAQDAIDEIQNYEITADVNDDATVNLRYHIEWTVLDDAEEGPLSWVSIGLPNSHVEDYSAISDNISDMDIDGNYAIINFDRKYYKNETVSFDFTIRQDNMYSMNELKDGETLYYFTPGWFDSIDVKRLVIRWNGNQALAWDGPCECLIRDGYCTWTTDLPAGETVDIKVSYSNDAFGFDASKEFEEAEEYAYDSYGDSDFGAILAGIAVIIGVLSWVGGICRSIYSRVSGFSASEPKVKITRTKIVYYSFCPGCGAPREEGKDTCAYCGRSMIQEEEILKEEEIAKEDREALKYKTNGTFQYSDSPNTYVRVHVTTPPRSSGFGGSHHSGSHHGGSHHGGGSSCACACVSCACACACACAGGGRAGCTTKDFYKTNLKLKQLELKKRNRR